MINIPVTYVSKTAKRPEYQSSSASGLDLCADLATDRYLGAGHFAVFPTGVVLAIPTGYEGQVRPRSGLAAKEGITVLNTPGTIDAKTRN